MIKAYGSAISSPFGGAGTAQAVTERVQPAPSRPIVVTFDDSNKKSPQKLDGNSKRNPTQNCKTVI